LELDNPRRIRIIILNDKAQVVDVYKKFLRKAGMEIVACFSNADETFSFFERRHAGGKIDKAEIENTVLLLDHQTLGGYSEDTARKTRTLDPSLKIILTTTKNPSQLKIDQNAIDAAIEKPFTIPELLEIIQKILSKVSAKGTVVLSDPEEIDRLLVNILSNSKEKLCHSESSQSLQTRIRNPRYATLFMRALAKGLRVQLITEITEDDLMLCKQLLVNSDVQIRHLDGLIKNFSIWDEKHFVEITLASDQKSIVKQLMYSNLEQTVNENQYLFDTLWSIAIPGAQKIQELEAIPQPAIRVSTVLSGSDEVARTLMRITSSSSSTLDIGIFLELGEKFLDPLLEQASINAMSRGVHCRLITRITSQNLASCEWMLQLGMEIRHLPALKGEYIISEHEVMVSSAINDYQGRTEVTSAIYSDDPGFVEQRQGMFIALWKVAIPASDRINEIKREANTNSSKLTQS
jgi:DNA-binding response OmpR family regulator